MKTQAQLNKQRFDAMVPIRKDKKAKPAKVNDQIFELVTIGQPPQLVTAQGFVS